ncbi:MAG: ORF6N domain-containing protein [Candidatus Riflebacteria bacterium]|nr:ORF6N domain-containing protein [Candidatus Riflebacteria bacterium]
MNSHIPVERIESKILVFRGQKVMIDSDLASLFGVQTKRLNEQVKRNLSRFPENFMFQLCDDEQKELVANCDRFERLKHSSANARAFTEHGTLMLANVLNSEQAIQASIKIVEAFVRMRHLMLSHADLEKKLMDMERKFDGQFRVVFQALHTLIKPVIPKRARIGFDMKSDKK